MLGLWPAWGVTAGRVFGPEMRERWMEGVERTFEQAPEMFPPKRMLRGIEETRANTERILGLLEQRGRRRRQPESADESKSPDE